MDTDSFGITVSATIKALGYLESGVYHPEPDCHASVHDLVRYLRSDDESMIARIACLEQNIIKNDLVPLILSPSTDSDLFELTLRLTVNLCQPALVCFGMNYPESEIKDEMFRQIEILLVKAINAFANPRIFEKFASVLTQHYSVEEIDRSAELQITVDRIILLLRYIFAIGMEGVVSSDVASVLPASRERMIHSFLLSSLPEVLLKAGCERRNYEVAIYNCEKVAKSTSNNVLEASKKAEIELTKVLENDRIMLAKKRALASGRSFLGGTYVLKEGALNAKKDLITSKATLNDPLEELRKRKQKKKVFKRRCVRDMLESVFGVSENPPSTLCRLLHEMTKKLIHNHFDRLMKTTRENAFVQNRSGVAIYSDVNYFFLVYFILTFIRESKLPVEKASSVFSKEFFNHLVSQVTTYFEMMTTDKDNIPLYTLRAQHGISAYRAMMTLLNALQEAKDGTNKELLSHMTENIFYMEEYREFGYMTISQFQPSKMTKKMLHDIIIGSQHYIRVLRRVINAGEHLAVMKKKRLARKRRRRQREAKAALSQKDECAVVDSMTQSDVHTLWSSIGDEVNEVLLGNIEATADLSPTNALLNISDADEQIFAALQIQRALRSRRVCDAIGLYFAARDLWPDTTFGDSTFTADEDMVNLMEICMIDMADVATKYDEEMQKAYGKDAADYEAEKAEEEHKSVSDNEEEKEENEEEEKKFEISEVNLDFADYVMSYARADCIKWYIFVAKDFETNEPFLNQCVVRMFHTIFFELKSPERLYSALLFRILLRVRALAPSDPSVSRRTFAHHALYEFGYHFLKKFFNSLDDQGDLMVCELLFPHK